MTVRCGLDDRNSVCTWVATWCSIVYKWNCMTAPTTFAVSIIEKVPANFSAWFYWFFQNLFGIFQIVDACWTITWFWTGSTIALRATTAITRIVRITNWIVTLIQWGRFSTHACSRKEHKCLQICRDLAKVSGLHTHTLFVVSIFRSPPPFLFNWRAFMQNLVELKHRLTTRWNCIYFCFTV